MGGGMAPKAGPNVMGGLAGGMSATRPNKKGMTGGMELSKYKGGGTVEAKGMASALKYQNKTNDASSSKKVKGGTGGIEGSKFKDGGHAAMTCKAEGGYTIMKKMQKC